jgi:competence protein ComEA
VTFAVRFVSIVLAFSMLSSIAASAQVPGTQAAEASTSMDSFTKLPPGQGRDVMVRVCSQCHSPEIVVAQQLDGDGWKNLVDEMANNGANGTDAEFTSITAYLAKAFPLKPDAPK